MLFTVGLGILLFLRLRQGSRNDHRAGHEHEILSSAVEPTGAPRRPFHSLVRRKDLAPIAETYAYASLLCDDVMLDATKVLIHSFRKTGSPYPFLLLVLPQVSQREELERLGAQVHVISELDYPFKVTAEKTAINKMCRYSKLHIWKFVQYRKIIFIDVDCLIIQNLDKAFQWPQFSAVRDAGDTFNTGLFVLEPSLRTYADMLQVYMTAPSYNQGDQGFLNWYFRNSHKSALPVKYNTVCKQKNLATWPLIKKQTKMIHYTSETKPWNFFASSHKYWKQNFDAAIYYLWARAYAQLARELRIDAFNPSRPMWLNSERVPHVCDPFHRIILEAEQQRPRKADGKTSVLFFKWRSLESLDEAIFHYRTVLADLVARIYILWNPSLGTPPLSITRYRYQTASSNSIQVEVLYPRYDSPNNLWSPIVGLSTRTIFYANDEHLPDQERFEIALETWKNNPNSLVGFFARHHGKQRIYDPDALAAIGDHVGDLTAPSTNASLPAAVFPSSIVDDHWHWTFNLTSIRRPRPYSLLSPHLLLLNADYLFTYTCLLPEKIHRFVDEQSDDSADLAMNLLVAGMTGNRPVLIKSDFAMDPEASRNTENWASNRAVMLKELIKLFNGGVRDPLLYSTVTIGQFNKIPFKKRSAKQWNNT